MQLRTATSYSRHDALGSGLGDPHDHTTRRPVPGKGKHGFVSWPLCFGIDTLLCKCLLELGSDPILAIPDSVDRQLDVYSGFRFVDGLMEHALLARKELLIKSPLLFVKEFSVSLAADLCTTKSLKSCISDLDT